VVTINGQSGVFYLHPRLSYHPGDFSYAFDPHESDGDLQVEIPNAFLKRGDNVISLLCVDKQLLPD